MPSRASPHALASGTLLAEFEIKGVIGQGGFGIVYRAYDHSLGRDVAVKEYMPVTFAGRQDDTHVTVLSEHCVEAFKLGLQSFVKEAQLLAKFDHPSLVKVYRFWEANGTAYMAMPFYDAPTLKQLFKRDPTVCTDEAWLKVFLGHILDALQVLHERNCYHRDIAPDNILMIDGHKPLLLDFGAARHVIADMTQTLTVIVKPGYAPIEQYGDMNHASHGPWTDLYALASVAYYLITGTVPLAAMSRLLSDSMAPLAVTAKDRYSPEFLQALDEALRLRPEHRPQSVAHFRVSLGLTPRPDQDRQLETAAHSPASKHEAEAPAALDDLGPTIAPPHRPPSEPSLRHMDVEPVFHGGGTGRRVARIVGGTLTLIALATILFWRPSKPPAVAQGASKPLSKPVPAVSNTPPICTLKLSDGTPACPTMVALPAASYRMGALPDDSRAAAEEFGAVTVAIAPFSLAAHEVSNELWQLCVNDGACPATKSTASGSAKQPVTQVSWDASQQFINWLSKKTGVKYRLPTEAEWEYAARGSTTTAYPWGDTIGQGNAHCGQCGSAFPITGPAPVGSFKDNRGLYDIAGNVYEWVDDCWYGSHADGPSIRNAAENATCRKKVQKGGAYDSTEADVRPIARTWDDRANADVRVGFRLAR
jgi:formylglycine-generating enzyme required for sulfatase activity